MEVEIAVSPAPPAPSPRREGCVTVVLPTPSALVWPLTLLAMTEQSAPTLAAAPITVAAVLEASPEME